MKFSIFKNKQTECDFVAGRLDLNYPRTRRPRFYFGAALIFAAVAFAFSLIYFDPVKSVIAGVVGKIKGLPAPQLPQALRAIGMLPQSGDRLAAPAADDKPREPIRPPAAPFDLKAEAGTIMDAKNNKILFAKNAAQARSIASITKLMTAMVFLENNPGWENIYQIKREDRREGGRIYLYMGEKVKVRDLFYLSLVGSANTATIALVGSTGMSEEEFVRKMNEKASGMGLVNTDFYDPAGLNNNNISTAEEIAKFAVVALADSDINEATLSKKYEFTTLGGRKKTVYSTDQLLGTFPQNGIRIIGGKTGYLELAGYSFVGRFIDRDGREMISVVLGSDSRDSRFSETRELAEWAYENYVW